MRQPKPFFRKQTKCWYVQLGKKQIRLSEDEKEAWDKYHEIMADRQTLAAPDLTVARLADAYLAWLQKKRSPATYEKARHYLSLFVRFVGTGLRVGALEPTKVTDWLDEYPDWTSTSKHDACSIVQRAFTWAVKHNHIVRSPIAYIEDKPKKKRREVVYTAADWTKLRALVRDGHFGDFIDFMHETGCRPLECRTLEARHVDLDNELVVFPPSEAKGEDHERVIYLTEKAAAILRRRIAEYPDGPLMRNSRGRPWTKDAVHCRFQRISKLLGQPANAYAIRHMYATEALKTGMDSTTVGHLMGHRDLTQVARTYSHLARDASYLKQQARRLKAAGD